MPDLLERNAAITQPSGPAVPIAPTTIEVDERAARRSLLEQVARLESELASLFCSTYPRTGFD
ncbi:MAG: hypothetical protein H0V08_00785, partial [Thermoleophilaceae bacterium]|nr:hypothetical protein [Thermoleophilaceae bacterium]